MSPVADVVRSRQADLAQKAILPDLPLETAQCDLQGLDVPATSQPANDDHVDRHDTSILREPDSRLAYHSFLCQSST